MSLVDKLIPSPDGDSLMVYIRELTAEEFEFLESKFHEAPGLFDTHHRYKFDLGSLLGCIVIGVDSTTITIAADQVARASTFKRFRAERVGIDIRYVERPEIEQ